MKTPAELIQILQSNESAATAITVYKEAAGYIKAFEEVKTAALACAQAEMEADGVIHNKTDLGSAGWTEPKTPRLDRARWLQLVAVDSRLKALQDAADQAQTELEAAQAEAGCMVLPERRFFIR